METIKYNGHTITVHELFGGKFNSLVFDLHHTVLLAASPTVNTRQEALKWAEGYTEGK